MRRALGTCLSALAISLAATLGQAAGEGPQGEPYAFFAAGHAYGNPLVKPAPLGLHPPFVAHFDALSSDPEMGFGFLLGDTVKKGTVERWDAVDRDLGPLGLPVHFVLGNHEATDTPLFVARYGPTYHHFEHEGDLFIVLDAYLDGWSIRGEQLDYLKRALESAREGRNVFIFAHPLVWWEPDNELQYVAFNSIEGRAEGPTNFWTELAPLLAELDGPVYWFAGDVGAFPEGESFMFHQRGNLRLIATGMGSEVSDNLVVTRVSADGQVDLDLVALGGDPGALGPIEAAELPGAFDAGLRMLRVWVRNALAD